MPATSCRLAPAITVAGRGERKRSSRAKLDAGAALNFRAERIEAAILDGVFQPRVLAILAIAPVALHGDDGFGDLDSVRGRAKAHDVGSARIGILLAMSHAHAAADSHVPTRDIPGLVLDCDVSKIVRKYVD